MPRSMAAGGGNMSHRIADLLKACRSDWRTIDEISDECGMKCTQSIRHSVRIMVQHGLVEQRTKVNGMSRFKVYRVAEAWRNE